MAETNGQTAEPSASADVTADQVDAARQRARAKLAASRERHADGSYWAALRERLGLPERRTA